MCIKSMNKSCIYQAIQEIQHVEPILFKVDKKQIENSFKTASIMNNSIFKNTINENGNNSITNLIKKYFGSSNQKK